MKKSTLNNQEIEQFNEIADDWWDESSSFKLLHRLNPVRMDYIKQEICQHFRLDAKNPTPFKKLRIADIGCGGGLITEPLHLLGAKTTGIDAGINNIKAAHEHAEANGLKIDYTVSTAEDMAEKKEKFDVVIALEIIEHVNNQKLFISSCCKLLKKNGILILSTLNRTPKSFMWSFLAAKYIFNYMPAGTHDWNTFLKPSEISNILSKNNFVIDNICGVLYKPLSKQFVLSSEDIRCNYLLSAIRSIN